MKATILVVLVFLFIPLDGAYCLAEGPKPQVIIDFAPLNNIQQNAFIRIKLKAGKEITNVRFNFTAAKTAGRSMAATFKGAFPQVGWKVERFNKDKVRITSLIKNGKTYAITGIEIIEGSVPPAHRPVIIAPKSIKIVRKEKGN